MKSDVKGLALFLGSILFSAGCRAGGILPRPAAAGAGWLLTACLLIFLVVVAVAAAVYAGRNWTRWRRWLLRPSAAAPLEVTEPEKPLPATPPALEAEIDESLFRPPPARAEATVAQEPVQETAEAAQGAAQEAAEEMETAAEATPAVEAEAVGEGPDVDVVYVEVERLGAAHLESELYPTYVRNQGAIHLRLTNHGERLLQCTITGHDPAGGLVFTGTPVPVTLRPGAVATINVSVAPRLRPLMGRGLLLPFGLRVDTAGGDTMVRHGQVEVMPRLPAGLLPFLGFLWLFVCLAGVFFYNQYVNRNQLLAATATGEPAPLVLPPTSPVTRTPTPVPLPLTCFDVKAADPEAGDGPYTVYVARDANRPVTIYCHDMAGSPAAYVELASVSDEANFASTAFPGDELVTQYLRVRIDMRTLLVDSSDLTFATTTGGVPDYSDATSTAYGVAIGCNEGGDTPVLGRGNVDLTGTDWMVAEATQFVLQGVDVQGPGATISADRKVVTLSAGGRCGWVEPVGGLYLDYAPAGAPATGATAVPTPTLQPAEEPTAIPTPTPEQPAEEPTAIPTPTPEQPAEEPTTVPPPTPKQTPEEPYPA